MIGTVGVYGLLAVNLLIFLQLLQSQGAWIGSLALWPLDSADPSALPAGGGFHLWQLLSYGFVHGSFVHLFLNMYALWLFGSVLENQLGSKRFIFLYLTCIVGAAVAHLLVQQLLIQHGMAARPVIGASGGTFGLLMAFAYLFPDSQLYLLIPPVPVKAKWFVVFYGIIELVFGVTATATGIAHFAHLGGMLTAYLIVRSWKRN